MRPQERLVPLLALWFCAGLLLSSLCLEEACVIGVVGGPVSLPCLSTELPSRNVSIEWRKNDNVVLRAAWDEDRNVETWSLNRAKVPADAALSGNFSLELPDVHPTDDRTHYSFFFLSGENQSIPLCNVCLRVAARFSPPVLTREEPEEKDEINFLCHSVNGYPQPVVYWLINDAKPPEGSVETQTTDGLLYNITSHLTIPVSNISKEATVTCIIENPSLNETLRATYEPDGGPIGSRASEAMWIFSTVLCVMVGIMVMAGVAYQIHLDRISKRRKKEHKEPQRGYRRRRRYEEEAEAMESESKETDV